LCQYCEQHANNEKAACLTGKETDTSILMNSNLIQA
jgi:hypothetical protein